MMTGSGPPVATNPYVGPRPYRRADADRFFGRDREARQVRSLWLAERVVVLHGEAASGKTSLLHAGILPLLSLEQDVEILPVGKVAHQAAHPLVRRPGHNGFSYALLGHWAPAKAPPPGTTVADFLRTRPRRLNEFGEPATVLAAIDQFEDLFTAFGRRPEREELIGELADALRAVPELRLLLVVRDDQLAAVASYERRLSPDSFAYVRLEPLTVAAAVQAVRGPLEGTGRSFADGADRDIVDRLRSVTYRDLTGEVSTLRHERVEPLFLQIVCHRLWRELPEDVRTIQASDVADFADVDRALTGFYDAAVHDVSLETGESPSRLRGWIESTFVTENGTRGLAYRGIETTADMPNRVVDALTDHHVLTAEQRALTTWYQLSQDRLISPVLDSNREWRAEHRADPEPAGLVPATPAAFRAAAEAAFAEGNFTSARRFADQAAQGYRDSGDRRRMGYVRALRGDIARAEGDLDGARAYFGTALADFGVLEDRNLSVRMISAIAEVFLQAGEYQAAMAEFTRAIDRLPTDLEARTGLGFAQLGTGSPADAEATFSQALGVAPHWVRALIGRALARVELRDHDGAFADVSRALELGAPPAYEADARATRAYLLAVREPDATERAESELDAARALDPERALTYLRAAQIADLTGRSDEAREAAGRALTGRPPLTPHGTTEARRLRDRA